MEQIKVSVIIPTYKRSEDICRAVDSVLNQTIDSYEVIVVDDNGIDTEDGKKTAEVMEKYSHDNRVIYLQHEKNKNGSAARNTGIKASRGKYISFLDDDDAYLPHRLEKMYQRLENLEPSWGACYTGYVKHQKNGTDQFSNEKNEGNLYIQTLMRSFYIGTGSNLFFRRTVIEDIGLFDESFKRNQDLEYLVRVLKKYNMAYVDDVLMEAFYDIRTTQLTFEQSKEREKLFRKTFSVHLNDLSEKEKREVLIMWDIDWIRILLSRKKIVLAIKALIQKKIPLKILFAYVKYALNRKKTNTCYGFIVRL